MTISELYPIYLQHPVICTDTRKITPGCLFFALKGENFDANDFAETALLQGAAFVVVDRAEVVKSNQFILVSDVLTALQDLAKTHRNHLNIPFIGITGSNGKTTTKELLHAVLSQHFRTFATVGNFNNHIGVPLTILSIPKQVEVAIVEMGANHQKEIEFLCNIARPTHGLITNVGKAHLEGFGGYEGVKKAKSELYAYLAESNGIVFINRDNAELVTLAKKFEFTKTVFYGKEENNFISGTYKPANDGIEVTWEADHKSQLVKSGLTGSYNFENILAAICVGYFFKLTKSEINTGIESYVPENNRSQIIKTSSNTLICDYYNANPSSMLVALENLASLNAETNVMILGDMFELGSESKKEHLQVIERAMQIPAERRIFIGEEFYSQQKDGAEYYKTTAEAAEAIEKNKILNALVLIKGSRGMKLEALVEFLT